jgi:two-component system LytT family sensor kinase
MVVGTSRWRLLDQPVTRRLILGWTLAYGIGSWLLEYLYARFGPHQPTFAAIGKNAIYALVWAPLLFALVWVSDRFPMRSPRDVARLLLYVTVSATAPFVWGTLAYYLCLSFVPGWEPWGVRRMFLKTFNGVAYVSTIVLAICHIARRIQGHREQELAALRAAEAATDAQLQVLSLELQPHFLRNALHSISALIYANPSRALEALEALGEMLRHAVRTASVPEVPLEEEVRALMTYVRIQQLRFGERLSLVWRIAPDVARAAIPNFLLQPLVENAIKFSVEALSGPRTVIVKAERVHDELVVSVVDDGLGPRESQQRSPFRGTGRGLSNAQQRLERLFGDRHSLTLHPQPSGSGTTVEVRLPFRRFESEVAV